MPLQPTAQDFQNQIDYSAMGSLSGTELNQGFAALQGNVTSDNLSGVVPCLWTIDGAGNVPNVPNPNASSPVNKWKKYIWFRIPAVTNITGPGQIYTWNDNAVSNVTFLKWINAGFDDTSILAQLTTLLTNVTTALNAANTANSNSTSALNTANDAETAASNASTLANTANTNADNANNAAVSANQLANTASSTATAALAAANSAISSSAANKNVNQINPSLVPGQQIRTNEAATANEYFSVADTIIILAEQQLTTVNGTACGSGGFVKRVLNTTIQDSGNNLAAFANSQFTLKAGTYRIRATIPIEATPNGATVQGGVMSRLRNTADNTTPVMGSNVTLNALNGTPAYHAFQNMIIEGVFATDGTKVFEIDTYNNTGLTMQTLTSSNNGGVENYTWVVLEKIG